MMGWRGGFTLEIRSLQTKFLIGTLLVLVLIMTGFITVVEQRQRSATVDEVQRRGEVLARSLAATSTGALLLYNFTALEQNVARSPAKPTSSTRSSSMGTARSSPTADDPSWSGSALDGAVHEIAAGTSRLLVQEAAHRKTGEPIYDIAMPVHVEGQKWGIARIGLSRRRMEAQIRRTRWELAGLSVVTLVAGGLGAAFVARRIALPVRQLAAGAEAISRGELDQQIAPAGQDEIGQLALTFNHMAAQLRHHQAEIEAAHAELRHRFEQLAELKNYTDSIFGSVTSGIVTLDLDGRVATLNPAAEMLSGLFAPDVTGRYCQEVFAHSPELERAPDGHARAAERHRVHVADAPPAERQHAADRDEHGAAARPRGQGPRRGRRLPGRHRAPRARRAAPALRPARRARHARRRASRTRSRTRSRRSGRSRDSCRASSTTSASASASSAWFRTSSSASTPSWSSFSSWPARRASPFRRFAFHELLDRTLDLYADQIEGKSIDVRREYARDCPPIQADPEYLYQALVNLVANALEAMAAGRSPHGPRRLESRGQRVPASRPLQLRPPRQGRDRGYGQRDLLVRGRQGLQSVLHDQGLRHRPRPRPHPQDRRRPSRQHHLPQRPGHRDHVPGDPPGSPRRRRANRG